MAADPRARITETEHKVDQLERRLESIRNAPDGNQNVTRVMVLSEPDPHREWRTALAVACVMAAAFALWVAADTRAELRAERVSREIMNKWTAQEVTAIRSYITTGKLAPMNPPPVQQEKEKP